MEGHSSDIDDPALGSKKRALLIEEPAPTLEEPPMVIEACKTDRLSGVFRLYRPESEGFAGYGRQIVAL